MRDSWRRIIFTILVCCFSVKTFSFPQIISWRNTPVVVYENKMPVVLKKDVLLKFPFTVITNKSDELEFKINISDQVIIYPKTKVQILEFLNDSGFVGELYISDGQIRYKYIKSSDLTDIAGIGEKVKKDLTLKTPFFDLNITDKVDFIIDLNMKEPSVEVKVISGVLPLEFFAYERTVKLLSGESVKFLGVLSEDGSGIKYDYLLKSRKVPKGAMGDIQKFDVDFITKAEKALMKAEEKKKQEMKLKAIAHKKKEDSFLCKNPGGQKNQCAWWVEAELKDNKCYRKRCNLSGEWGDLTERPRGSELCQKSKNNFFVADCDY